MWDFHAANLQQKSYLPQVNHGHAWWFPLFGLAYRRMTTPDGQLQHCAKPYSGPKNDVKMSGRHRTMKHHNHSSNLRTKQLKIFWVELLASQFWSNFFPSCFQDPMDGRTLLLSDWCATAAATTPTAFRWGWWTCSSLNFQHMWLV